MTDDILDDLFHACSLAAYLQQAQIQRGWPDSEVTRRRACTYFEEASRRKTSVTAAGRSQTSESGGPPAMVLTRLQ